MGQKSGAGPVCRLDWTPCTRIKPVLPPLAPCHQIRSQHCLLQLCAASLRFCAAGSGPGIASLDPALSLWSLCCLPGARHCLPLATVCPDQTLGHLPHLNPVCSLPWGLPEGPEISQRERGQLVPPLPPFQILRPRETPAG